MRHAFVREKEDDDARVLTRLDFEQTLLFQDLVRVVREHVDG
jgi:hypothetical protein